MKRAVCALILITLALTLLGGCAPETPSPAPIESPTASVSATPTLTVTAPPTVIPSPSPEVTPTSTHGFICVLPTRPIQLTPTPTATPTPTPTPTPDKEQVAPLDAAEQALKKKDFLFQTYISTEELAIEEFAPVLNEFLSEYGVQAHNIISLGGGYWDAWDAEGNFYGGSMCEFEAAITDGQNSRTVTRVIMFGVRGDKIYGPGGAKE